MTLKTRGAALAAAALTSLLALTACASGGDPASTEGEEHDHEHGHEHGSGEATEVAGAKPRVVLTYEGGVMVLDAETLEVVDEFELEGFNRLNEVGDGRNVLVSTTGGWAPLDAGAWTEPHGDHTHSYTTDPSLGEVIVPAEAPGHVVVHDGYTTLFDDGTGEVTVVETGAWTEAIEHGEVEPTRTYTTEAPHHGVAVASEDGTLFVTNGTEEERNGAVVLDEGDAEIASTDQCPGIHGETVVDGSILAGCDDGVVLLHGDHFHKIDSPDAYGRIGNQFSVEGSPIVLGDYNDDPEAEGIALDTISLVDTESESIQLVELDTEYTYSNLARGIDGSVLVLGTDGALRVIDPETGETTSTIDVIDEWTPPVEWQKAHPAIHEERGYVYVTDPANNQIHRVDYASGEVVTTADLEHAPNELVVTTG